MSFVDLHHFRREWPKWNPVERGDALLKLRQSGVKTGNLARMIRRSKETVRYLMTVAKLPEEHRKKIAAGASPRSFVKALRKRSAIRKKVIALRDRFDREKAVERGLHAVRYFFRKSGIREGLEEQFCTEALAYVRGFMLDPDTPNEAKLARGQNKTTLSQTRPSGLERARDIDLACGYFVWFYEFMRHLVPNLAVREEVFMRAVSEADSLRRPQKTVLRS